MDEATGPIDSSSTPPTPNGQRPTANSQRPTASGQRPTASGQQPTTNVPTEPREGYTAVGRVLKPHGLKGEIRVEAFSPAAPNLQAGRFVFINSVRSKIVRARPDRGAWIIQVAGFASRDSVEGLRGLLLEARDSDVRRDDDESYFIHELIGLRVITNEGEALGRITEVLQSGAADVYVIRDGDRELLIPAIGDVVNSIDLAAGEMRITPLPGLLDKSK